MIESCGVIHRDAIEQSREAREGAKIAKKETKILTFATSRASRFLFLSRVHRAY
ncbi:MAG: hypothetical protein ACODAQ_01830 [Phycisphaeraceae bacterium]